MAATRILKQSRLPSPGEYARGLDAITPRMSGLQRRMLIAQYYAPYRSVTVKQLAQLANVSGGWRSVNLQYGRLGRMFCEEIGFTLDNWPGGSPDWWSIWSLGYRASEGFVWEMLPQVAEVLESLDWVTPVENQIPEEVLSDGRLVEGATRRITVNAYERNKEARQRCIEHYGSNCAICELDLGFVYGPVAQGFIHVHHLKALSEIGGAYKVDPVVDLRPVCPNCHAVIHIGGRTRTIEEVRKLIEERDIHREQHEIVGGR